MMLATVKTVTKADLRCHNLDVAAEAAISPECVKTLMGLVFSESIRANWGYLAVSALD